MSDTALPSRWRRCVLSIFILLNLSTVLYMNLPKQWSAETYQQWSAALPESTKHQLSLCNWRWQQYAHIAGLSNQWQMFGKQSNFNWWYDIRGVYSDGTTTETVLLPLPNQSARTFAEKYLFDLKERKFALNIYLNQFARQAYQRYLAQCYPEHLGLPLTEIRWKLCYQMILPPEEAVQSQQLVSPKCWYEDCDHYVVPRTESRLVSQEVAR
jgi:hypothetical protein